MAAHTRCRRASRPMPQAPLREQLWKSSLGRLVVLDQKEGPPGSPPRQTRPMALLALWRSPALAALSRPVFGEEIFSLLGPLRTVACTLQWAALPPNELPLAPSVPGSGGGEVPCCGVVLAREFMPAVEPSAVRHGHRVLGRLRNLSEIFAWSWMVRPSVPPPPSGPPSPC